MPGPGVGARDAPLNRALQRAGLRGVLPPGIAVRRSKARFSEVWLRDIDGHLAEPVLEGARVVRTGWIDLARARAALELTRAQVAGPRGAGPIFLLWGLLQVESVVRALGRT